MNLILINSFIESKYNFYIDSASLFEVMIVKKSIAS